MNPIDGQLLLALTCVAVAGAVLVRRFVLMIKNPETGGCGSGGCSSCPASSQRGADGFVSLEVLSHSESTDPDASVVRQKRIETS